MRHVDPLQRCWNVLHLLQGTAKRGEHPCGIAFGHQDWEVRERQGPPIPVHVYQCEAVPRPGTALPAPPTL